MMARRPTPPAPAQLPLDLPLQPRFGREDFLVGPSNEQAYALVDLWPNWPARFLVLCGPEGAGKSHLAAIWAAQAGARILSARGLATSDPHALAGAGAVVLEDADTAPLAEAPLFHLINLIGERSAHLLITARNAPDRWNIRTPDLLSRLRMAPRLEIAPPDDALLRALIVKQFLDRQIVIDTGVVEYLLTRMERSFAGAQHLVDALDREALALGRRITRPVAAAVLERMVGSAE